MAKLCRTAEDSSDSMRFVQMQETELRSASKENLLTPTAK